MPGGVTKGQARGAQRPREHRPSAFNRPRRATPDEVARCWELQFWEGALLGAPVWGRGVHTLVVGREGAMRGPGRTARSSRQLGSRCVCFRECGELAQEAQAANHAIALEIKNAGRTFPPNLATISSQSSTRSNSRDRARFGATISVEPPARPAHRWRVVPTFPFARVSSAQNSLDSSLPVAAQKHPRSRRARRRAR